MKLVALFFVLIAGWCSAEELVCFFPSWAVYRPGDGKYNVEDIDPHWCTTLIYIFAGLDNSTSEIKVLDPWNDLCPAEGGNNCGFKRFVGLKNYNADLTVLLSIGGWNEGSTHYSIMAADAGKRSTFIKSVITLLHKQNFDGLDFDWEYPTQRGGKDEDKANFVTLMKEMREAFDSAKPPLKLTGDFPGDQQIIDSSYDLKALVPYLDYFHIMTYDYHGCWEYYTHNASPLCGYKNDSGYEANYNVNYTITHYINKGVPKDKLIMGIPFYSNCFLLDDYSKHGIGAPAHKCSLPGPYLNTAGTLGANEICVKLKNDHSCIVAHDPDLLEPYFYCMSDNTWCGYDSVGSFYRKARYAKNMGLGGVMIWSMDEDDFHGQCYNESSHYLLTVKRALAKAAGGDVLDCSASPTAAPPVEV